MSSAELARLAARRAARQPFFLASLLLSYAGAEGIDEAELARRLGCPEEHLASVLLCRRPSDGRNFATDVRRIADRFGLDAMRLAEIVRMAEALEALRAIEGRSGALLAAARDRNEGPEPNEPVEPGGQGE